MIVEVDQVLTSTEHKYIAHMRMPVLCCADKASLSVIEEGLKVKDGNI